MSLVSADRIKVDHFAADPTRDHVTLQELAADLHSVRALATTVTIALAASATTDGMEATITVTDGAGNTVAAVHPLEVWFSDSDTTGALTASAYSGALTAVTGNILTALTAKKHVSLVTAATGIAVLKVVASANPTTEYVYVKRPDGAGVVISEASGTSWEGA